MSESKVETITTDAGTGLPRLLNAKQVAAETGLSVWAVYDAVRENRIPHRKIGRRVVFTREALAPFLNGSDVPASARSNNCQASMPCPATSKPLRKPGKAVSTSRSR